MLVDKVQSFGGRVEEMSPTGIVAAFGLEPVEDAPRRAVHAAMAIHNAAERAGRIETESSPVKIGIHVGQFLVGQAAGGPEIDLDAKRQAWAVLDALLARGEPATTVISGAAATFLERRFHLVPLGALEGVRGQAYRLGGRERTGLGLGRRMVRLVGRRDDLELLQSRLGSAAEGHGQVVGIVGEAGIGKSRLLFELRQSLRGKSITYLEGRCLSYGSAIPYLPILDVLRQGYGIAETDQPETVSSKVRAGFQQVELDPEEWAPFILQLFGVKEGVDRLAALSPEVIKSGTHETLRQLALKGSRLQPIIFVLEDLHWIDKTSEECVASLVDSIGGAPILFLSTYRPGSRPPWMDKSYATQVALQPLSPQESLSVVQSVLRTEQVPQPLAQLILAKAEGNPFFLEELARVLGEQEDLRATQVVPETIQEVVLARIHRLADEPKRLLQTASVLGREVPLRLLKEIWEGPGALDPHLRELMRSEFLYEKTRAAEPVYVFKHALTHEVAYESLPPSRRQALHAAAGRALERLYAGRLEEVYDHLAYHYSKTDEAPKAVEYLTHVAAKAARANAHIEAVRALQEAIVLVQRLPAEEQERQILDLILRQGTSLIPLGRIQEILDLLLRQQEVLERIGDPSRIGYYYFLLGRTYSFLGDHERVTQSAQRAIREAERCGDEATMGKAYSLLALDAPLAGEGSQGTEHGRKAVTFLERTGERWWLGQAYWLVGMNHAQLGQIEAALEAEAQARAIGEAIGDPRLPTFSDWVSGVVHAWMGEGEEGIRLCQRGLERSPDPLNTAICMGWLGLAYLENGDPRQAMSLLESSLQQLARFGFRQFQGWFTIFLSECYLGTGQIEKAQDLAVRGLEFARDAKYRYVVGWAQRTLGRISRARGAFSEAATQLNAALETFASTQARYDLARTHLDLAELAQAQGNRKAVTDHLQEASEAFRALKVPRLLERAERYAREFGIRPTP
ncbi:MAG: AAA family ATPase [Candidatus Rokubacteria bacterium]|nr:AAA family ATPase [Candidatus Rokubacteria bacterium]